MGKTDKLDLYKEFKTEYAATRSPRLVEVAPARYLAIEGRGDPEAPPFQEKIAALYGAAFTIKMTRKFAGLGDYAVCKLEGLWWTGDKRGDFADVPREAWRWKLLIRTPDFIGDEDLAKARESLAAKGKADLAKHVKLETLAEGRCVQVLHVGPYAEECATVALMQRFAAENDLKLHGRHHEIYLSDPRRVAPEKLRTILRHPVR